MPRLIPRRPLWRGLLAAGAVIVALGVAAIVVVVANKPHNVSHPDLEFTNPTTPATTTPQQIKRKQLDNFQWPVYGYTQSRTHTFAAPPALKPPLHVGWAYNDGALLEFPPVIYHRAMFVLDDDASAKELNITNGKVIWQRKLGTLAAASPVVAGHQGEVLMPTLSNHGHAPGGGSFFALSMKTGKILWRRPVGAGSETSPIVSGRTVYYGDGAGNLYARDVVNGHLDWAYHAAGAIKGGPALVNGVLYFGDYAGRAYAVRASNGHQIWAVSTDGAHFGFGSGQFYTTPAVAFGRVYMGNTDGFVYSFGAAQRQARVGDSHRRIRLRVGGGRRPQGRRTDRLRRLLRRELLRVQRPVGRDPLEASGRRPDLGLGDRHRQRRLLLRIWPPRRRSASTTRPASRCSSSTTARSRR